MKNHRKLNFSDIYTIKQNQNHTCTYLITGTFAVGMHKQGKA